MGMVPEGSGRGGAGGDVAVATRRQLSFVLERAATAVQLPRPPRCLEQRIRTSYVSERLTAAATVLDLSGVYLGPRVTSCVAALTRFLPLLEVLRLRGVGMYATDVSQKALGTSGPGGEGRVQCSGNDAVAAVASSALEHPSLTELDLSDNHIGTLGAKHVLHALERNGRLRSVDLGGSNIDADTRHLVEKQLERNLGGKNKARPPRRLSFVADLPADAELREEEEARTRRQLIADLEVLPPSLREIFSTAGSPVPDTSQVTPSSFGDSVVYTLVRGCCVVTTEEPARGQAGTRRTSVSFRYAPGDLLPFAGALAQWMPVQKVTPRGWGGVDADSVQLASVLGDSAITVCSVMFEAGARLWSVDAACVAPALAPALAAALPALRHARLLQPLPWSYLLWIASRCTAREFEPGDEIVAAGDTSGSLHVIDTGGVAIEEELPAGLRELAGVEAGDVLAGSLMREGYVAAVARTVVRTLEVSPDAASRLLADPRVRALLLMARRSCGAT
eukprot:Hpha_TRINITY_DN6324_c0_g1::TRINITY_DN6324_c0_g1_i1::g.145493::m.145493